MRTIPHHLLNSPHTQSCLHFLLPASPSPRRPPILHLLILLQNLTQLWHPTRCRSPCHSILLFFLSSKLPSSSAPSYKFRRFKTCKERFTSSFNYETSYEVNDHCHGQLVSELDNKYVSLGSKLLFLAHRNSHVDELEPIVELGNKCRCSRVCNSADS